MSGEQMLWMLTVAWITRHPFGVVAMTAENERLRFDIQRFRETRRTPEETP